MPERRSSYRVQQGLEAIAVSMAWPGHDYVSARLIDLSARGASVALSFPASDVPEIPAETSVYLNFDAPGLEPISGILALVRNVRNLPGERVFGLEIVDWRRLHDSLPATLFGLFNRRRHYRVKVPRQPPIEVAVLRVSGESLTAHLCDISVGGCLLLLETEIAVEEAEKVKLKFRLPDSDYYYELPGVIRSGSEHEDSKRCGVEFESTQSMEAITRQQRIAHYVMERQRKVLAQ
ncbi:MAG TPA: PilZ domain-containing protein, partial [Gammaproteobacteria bacterium]